MLSARQTGELDGGNVVPAAIAAQAKQPQRRKAPVELPETLLEGVSSDDQSILRSLGAIARDHSTFHAEFTVDVEGSGPLAVIVDHDEGHAVFTVGGELAAPARSDESVSYEEQIDDLLSGGRVVDLMTDALVITPDPVGIFASVGAEALWANDAFATTIPIREDDRIWLVELLDEWSRAHYEVNVLPALIQHGRWHGTLTFESGDETLTLLVSLVAHRDEGGEVEAVTMIGHGAGPTATVDAAVEPPSFARLVENPDDLLFVVGDDGLVAYSSPALTGLLGLVDGALVGLPLADRIHPDDRGGVDFVRIAEPDEDGVAPPMEMRLEAADGGWRIIEMISTDLRDNPAIGGVVVTAFDVTERVERVQRLANRAYTDPLTLLPNRMRLLDRLGQALAGAPEMTVVTLLVNIDDFRAMNEIHGRAVGDEVLRQAAQRLNEAFSTDGLVARMRGDEFVVVLEAMPDVDSALLAADRIRVRLGEPYRVGTATIAATVRVGVAVSRNDISPVQLLTEADTAAAAAREQGGDRVAVMTAELRAATAKRRDLEDLLQRALAGGDGVEVHYQPVFDVETEEVVGAEALLRVHDDDGAILSPGSFLEAAEDAGIIAPLGGLVLQLTCRQLADWKGSDEVLPSEISVNVSPRQLADPGFVEMVRSSISEAGIEPADLSLEITESVMIGGRGAIDQTISGIRELGVRIGLDEFGAGQSSLGYLKRFPLDFVKLDRELVAGTGTDESDTAIIRATAELAHNLGLDVVAVGVEELHQLEALQLLGVDRAQGFYLLPPVPPGEMAERLRART